MEHDFHMFRVLFEKHVEIGWKAMQAIVRQGFEGTESLGRKKWDD